jgi:flagellar biosynthesis/type III secretory pathway M-ring protein FliF/YscJ
MPALFDSLWSLVSILFVFVVMWLYYFFPQPKKLEERAEEAAKRDKKAPDNPALAAGSVASVPNPPPPQ